jgi:hypothetical protein
MTPARVWTLLAAVYSAFFYWYTSFGGPLSSEEIERYVGLLRERGATAEQIPMWQQFMETDTGDDFAMLNVIELREVPLQVEGVAPGESSREVLSRYTSPFMRAAVLDAAHPVFMGTAAGDALDVWGIKGAEKWTMGALVRYRSRRDIMEQVLRTGDTGVHEFKIAAMSKTIAFPVDPWFQLGDPRLVLGLLFASLGLTYHLRSALKTSRGGSRLLDL